MLLTAIPPEWIEVAPRVFNARTISSSERRGWVDVKRVNLGSCHPRSDSFYLLRLTGEGCAVRDRVLAYRARAKNRLLKKMKIANKSK